jgi:hypothetical protein
MISFCHLLLAIGVTLTLLQSAVSIPPNQQDRPIRDFDDGPGRTFEQDKPRIDRFVKELKKDDSAVAYTIAYGGLDSYKNEAKIRLTCMRKYLTTNHKIPRSRFKLIDGGHRMEITVQLILVKPGDSISIPYATVKPEAVRVTKKAKTKCD